MASEYLSGSRGKAGKTEESALVARAGRTHLEDVGHSGLRAEDQPGVGLDVGVFSRFLLGGVLPVCGAVASRPREERRNRGQFLTCSVQPGAEAQSQGKHRRTCGAMVTLRKAYPICDRFPRSIQDWRKVEDFDFDHEGG